MCDTVVVVRPDGDGVLFAKNSDRDPNESQLLDWQPRRTHPAGARVRCTWIEIPQVRETFAVLLSRPFWMWGAEIGANERGVVMGNEAVFTREPVARTGLTGMDLLRLALERAPSARTAVDTVRELIQTHGPGGGCGHENRSFRYHSSFLVADPTEAWLIETAGSHFAAEEITGARSISNALTIPGFAERFSDGKRTRVAGARSRRACTQALAEQASGAADLMALLRDHGDGRRWPAYRRLNGALSAPCVHAGGAVAASQTTASWVAELSPGAVRHWVTGTAAPCVSLFKPVEVAAPIELGPEPDDRIDEFSLWWRHERLHRSWLADPEQARDALDERDALEARWLATPPAPEQAFKEGDAWEKRWWDRALPAGDRRPRFVRRYWEKRNRRAGAAPILRSAGRGPL